MKKVCSEEHGLTLEELENDLENDFDDLEDEYTFLTACYQLRALKRFTVKQNSFKQGSPDAVMLITSELPSDNGKYFALKKIKMFQVFG